MHSFAMFHRMLWISQRARARTHKHTHTHKVASGGTQLQNQINGADGWVNIITGGIGACLEFTCSITFVELFFLDGEGRNCFYNDFGWKNTDLIPLVLWFICYCCTNEVLVFRDSCLDRDTLWRHSEPMAALGSG